MTQEEQRKLILINGIKNNCYEVAEKLLGDFKEEIRADAIDELGKVLCDELDNGYIFMNKHQILHFTEQLKEGGNNDN